MNATEFYHFFESPGSTDQRLQNELSNLVKEFPLFQAGWMLYLKSFGDQCPENILRNGAIRIPDRKRLYQYLNSGPDISLFQQNLMGKDDEVLVPEENNAKIPSQGNSLIDKFLASDSGKIGKVQDLQRTEVPPGNERIIQSVTENEEIITETLALIYFQQKKYEKALEAFRKLSLKYPEKSVYFAARIEEIEILKNI